MASFARPAGAAVRRGTRLTRLTLGPPAEPEEASGRAATDVVSVEPESQIEPWFAARTPTLAHVRLTLEQQRGDRCERTLQRDVHRGGRSNAPNRLQG